MDIVYTFVDGSDIEWQQLRECSKQKYYDPAVNNTDSNTSNRFKSRDELKYSLRSVAMYAKFCRDVILVVQGQTQIPEWINLETVRVVFHSEIIPPEYLPTFNSHTIEAHLHNIPNVSSPFLYLNDDILFNAPVTTVDFWEHGKIKVCLDSRDTCKGAPKVGEYAYRSAWKNVNNWLDRRKFNCCGKTVCHGGARKKMAHAPSVILPHVIKVLWSYLPDEFAVTCNNRFRSIKDYSLTPSLHPYFCLYNDIGVESSLTTLTLYVGDNFYKNQRMFEAVKAGVHIFCIEDGSISPDNGAVDDQITQFLKNKYTSKSIFERV